MSLVNIQCEVESGDNWVKVFDPENPAKNMRCILTDDQDEARVFNTVTEASEITECEDFIVNNEIGSNPNQVPPKN